MGTEATNESADGDVTQSTRADLASDHLPRVQTDTQPQFRAVAVLDFDGKPLGLHSGLWRRRPSVISGDSSRSVDDG